jgi:hypothetical protein
MSFWFRTYRENVDDPQNSMMAEMFQLILQARQNQSSTTTPTDVERKRVLLMTTESYLILISDGCFVISKQRYLNLTYKWYLGREPDGIANRCWLEFDYRSNIILDRSLRGNNAILKGYPTIIAYQPEYPQSSYKFDGAAFINCGFNANLNVGETAGSEVTYSFWIYFTANPAASAAIMAKSGSYGILPYIGTGGTLQCDFKYHDTTSFFSSVSAAFFTKNTWHHVIIEHSDKTDTSKVILDNVERATNTKNDYLRATGTGTATARLLIGALSTGASTQTLFLPANTYLDDVRIYDRLLTAQEKTDLLAGEDISPIGLVSQWHFNEDQDPLKILDEQSYNDGTAVAGGAFEKTIIPSVYTGVPVPYEDGMIDKIIGYKTNGEYLFIPEFEDDFRITGKTTGGLFYRWTVKLTTFDIQNENYMRLFEKCDDVVPNYFQSYQIGPDGKFYCFGIFNGVQKKIRTVNPLSLLKLYDIIAGIDFDSIAGGVATNIFKIYINGFPVATESTSIDADVPQTTNITSFGVRLLTGTIVSRGYLVGQIYSFRYYEEDITAANALGLMTNKFTTYNIDRGHVVRNNMTKLPLSLAFRSIAFDVPISVISEAFSFSVTDAVLTGRFSNLAAEIPISDDFDFFTTPTPTLGNYAIDLTNTSSIHSWVEIPTIDPVKDHFSVFAWVKFRAKIGDWAGIISAIDGLDNGNRLLIDATHIRWQGQFDKESNNWEDFRVTVPSLTGAYHLIGFTYDGDDKKFIIFLDGVPQKTFKVKGDIRGTDKSKTFIGKGSKNGFYLDGVVDDVFIYEKTLKQSDVNKLWLKQPVEKGLMAYFNWELTFKDVEDGKFNGKKVGTVVFSSDHV